MGDQAAVRVASKIRTISVLAAGMPDWLPAEGQYSRIPMVNTLASQEPKVPSGTPNGLTYGRGFGAILAEFNGAAFADGYSQLGAVVIYGGGSGGWWGNDVHVGNLSSLTWKRILDPSPECLAPNMRTIRGRPQNSLKQFLSDRTPQTEHTYATPQYMPPSWGASGPLGAYVKVCATLSKRIFAEKVDLAKPFWDQITSESEAGVHQGLAMYPMATRDDSRQCFYAAQGYQVSPDHYWMISKTGVVTRIPGGVGTHGLVCCMGYAPPPIDLIVGMSPSDSPNTITLSRPGMAGGPRKPGTTGQRMAACDPNGAHPEWDPDRNCFVFWDPLAETIYKLHPPDGDPLSKPWAWTSEVLQKSAAHTPKVVRKAPGGQWSKLRRIPALKAFVYPASITELQIIRPKGA